jgi:putative membrane protein
MTAHIHYNAPESFLISGVLIFLSLLYLRQSLRSRKHDHGLVEDWRAISFLFGLFLIWVATASPLAALDHEMLTAHMVQHLLLMALAPPLILLGMPRKPAHGLSRRFLQAITHPAVCWLAATSTLVVWHIPSVFMLTMRSQTWHGIEQASFLASGLLFWWPVIEPSPRNVKWPESAMLLYLFLATLPCDILSGFLVFCDRVVYPVFLSSPRSVGFSALEDQQCAGALMWTSVTVVYFIAAAVFTVRLLSPHRLGDRGIPRFDSRQIVAGRTYPRRIETV